MCIHKISPLAHFEIDHDQHVDNCQYVSLNNQIESDSSDLTILQHNIRGLTSKIGELNYMLSHSLAHGHPDIILLCETWLTPNSPRPYVPGYEVERTDRRNKKGGGVGILLSARCKYTRRKDLEANNSACLESCFVEVKNWNSNLIIGSLYRPPNTDVTNFLDKVHDIIITAQSEKKQIILGLDHNLDLLKEARHSPTHNFLEMIYDNGLIPTITRPTRITTSTATLIDNIIMNYDMGIKSRSVILEDNTSDHLPCFAVIPDINPSRRELMKVTSRDIREKNMNALKSKLQNTSLLPANKTGTLDERFDAFHTELQRLIDHFLPLVTRTISKGAVRRESWVTGGLLISIRKCKLLFKRHIRDHKNINKWNKYREYNKQLKRTKRAAKRKFYYDKCEEHKHNTKKLWKTINSVTRSTNNKTEVIEKLRVNNGFIHGGEQITEEFASHFARIGKKYATQMPDPKHDLRSYVDRIPLQAKSIYLEPITPMEINKLIDNLQPKKSSGTDNIDNTILKDLKPYLTEPLSTLFNESMLCGTFPSAMKTAKVVPLFKSKSREETTNYRPISLLLTISKLLEKAMYTRVYSFLTSTDQLYVSQYGFRKKHGCDHAVGELIANISKGIEQGKLTASIFLDLSKAFDSLEHKAIFMKMERYGLRGICLDWFKSYLKDRKLKVSCRTADTGTTSTSSLHTVEYGTAQGSCLGPLIFLIFCNDLQMHLEFLNCIQFADDTTLYVTHNNINYIRFCIEHDLLTLQDWFLANKLTLNIGKSICILFGKHQRNQPEYKTRRYLNSTSQNYQILGYVDRSRPKLERACKQANSKA